ncbi:hypothetical protein BsWGS_21841 [Bradybaena similaris]
MAHDDFESEHVSVAAEEEEIHFSRSLPIHVKNLMYGKSPRVRPRCPQSPNGMMTYKKIQNGLRELPKIAPWTKTKSDLYLRRDERTIDSASKVLSSQSKAVSKDVSGRSSRRKMNKTALFEKMISENVNGKIAFVPLPLDSRGMPSYVMTRLETACRSARYELPMNKQCLENLTALEYLTKYTHLYKEQRDRYMRVYKRFKQKNNEYVEFNNLYPALNSMFGGFLSQHNFEVLCTALYLNDSSIFDPNTFVCICTFTDRLYWSTYIEGANSFNYWAPNRSAIEVIDFLNLKWKLDGLNITRELLCLLHSLA